MRTYFNREVDSLDVEVPAALSEAEAEAILTKCGHAIAGGIMQFHLTAESMVTVSKAHWSLLHRLIQLCSDFGVNIGIKKGPKDAACHAFLVESIHLVDTELTSTGRIRALKSNLSLLEGSKRLSLTIVPDFESIRSAVDKLIEFIRGQGVGKLDAYVIRTVVFEALANIKEHAHLTPLQSIELDVKLVQEFIEMTFRDEGVYFDWSLDGSHDIDQCSVEEQYREHFGLTLLHVLADSIRYQRSSEDVNILVIRKGFQN